MRTRRRRRGGGGEYNAFVHTLCAAREGRPKSVIIGRDDGGGRGGGVNIERVQPAVCYDEYTQERWKKKKKTFGKILTVLPSFKYISNIITVFA